MSRGGYRPGAGRPKGAPKPGTKEKKALDTLVAADPVKKPTKKVETSLEFAMAVINDDDAPLDAKIKLAIAAMPFQHPKLEAAAPGKKEQRQEAAEAAAKGKFAPPPPPGGDNNRLN